MKVNHNEICKYYRQGIYPKYEKVYAFGDIHGDFNAFIYVLNRAGLINNEYHWCGGDAHVVQVGDILDRKIRDGVYSDEDSEFDIISLILRLQLEAYMSGGGFHPVIGNHELMNILGIFDYVSPMGMQHFKNAEGRLKYFKIGNDFCKYLACAWNPVIKIGDFIFCHGGLSYNIVKNYSIDEINFIMRDTLYGNTAHLNQRYFSDLFLGEHSILWTRIFSVDVPKHKEIQASKQLDKILTHWNAKYLVLGHTPQINGVRMRFGGKVICTDTAMSEAFGKKNQKTERIHYISIKQNANENKIILF